MAGVVAGEMTVLYESLLVMAACNEVDLLVEAHLGRMGRWLSRLNWSGWVDCQGHGQCDERAAYFGWKFFVDVLEVLRCRPARKYDFGSMFVRCGMRFPESHRPGQTLPSLYDSHPPDRCRPTSTTFLSTALRSVFSMHAATDAYKLSQAAKCVDMHVPLSPHPHARVTKHVLLFYMVQKLNGLV